MRVKVMIVSEDLEPEETNFAYGDFLVDLEINLENLKEHVESRHNSKLTYEVMI